MTMHVEHQTEEQTFYATAHGYEGELSYSRPADGVVDFQHTYVDEELRGQGVSDALAKRALEWARSEKLRVRTSCTFMAKFVKHHQADYADLLEQQD